LKGTWAWRDLNPMIKQPEAFAPEENAPLEAPPNL